MCCAGIQGPAFFSGNGDWVVISVAVLLVLMRLSVTYTLCKSQAHNHPLIINLS